MTNREKLFAVVLVIGASLIVAGVALWSTPVALIIAGVLVVVIGYAVLGDVPGDDGEDGT